MKRIPPEESDRVFSRIGSDWMLICTNDHGGLSPANAMTASWGGLGVLWNRPVAFLFVRPQRHTFALLESETHAAVAFLGEEYREALRLCGTRSGRELDKFAATGLTVAYEAGIPYPEQAHTVLLCKKLYAQDLEGASFLEPELLQNYKQNDFHRMYVCEIESVLVR